ncbi:MAG: recombinase family protein [Alphaproteobacteria bacterium]|nr:recombinase family protein [Alphaproteobacteria bacterium]
MKDLKAKILRGQKERTRAGFHMGSPSYGYYVIRGKVDEKNQNVNGIRKINPEQAKIVKLIFEQYANGESIAQIMRNLDDKGIPV